MGDTQVRSTQPRGPVVLVGAAVALAVATLLLSSTWGTGSELTVGQRVSRRSYLIGVALLGPLLALTLLSARRALHGASVVAWVSALAALLVWLVIF